MDSDEVFTSGTSEYKPGPHTDGKPTMQKEKVG
jgi:hypothetical protein